MSEMIERRSGMPEFVSIERGPALLMFQKDGQRGTFDIVDGRFDYVGDLPISDAARLLFDLVASQGGAWWAERAFGRATGPSATPTPALDQ